MRGRLGGWQALLIGMAVGLVVLLTVRFVDGPRVLALDHPGGGGGPNMPFGGRVVREGDCLYLDSPGQRPPLIWPSGSQWVMVLHGVQLANGGVAPIGANLRGHGYLVHHDEQLLAALLGPDGLDRARVCTDGRAQVAVFDAVDQVA